MLHRPSNRYNGQDLWQKDHDHFLHPYTHFDSFKKEGSLVIVEGDGCYLRDVNGKRYFDGIGGMWCVNVGYGRREIAETMAEQAMQRAVATADRAKADRTADPTIGVHAGYEASRAERVVGLSFSIPLGGTYRAAQSREALQQADAARDALEAERRELEMEIAGALAEAGGGIERWKSAEAALAASSENARLSQRAYALGEGDIQGVLLARRQSLDAALGALQARIDALRARWRLWVDAHLIWKLAED